MSEVRISQTDFMSFAGRAKYMYFLRSEQNELIPYVPNEAQAYLEKARDEEFERSLKRDGVRRCKFIMLKSRQVGGTTDTAMFNGDIMLQLKLARGLVLAHDDLSTSIIYNKYKTWYNGLPEEITLTDDNGNDLYVGKSKVIVKIKPPHEAYSGFRLKFSEEDNWTGADMIVRTAGSGDNVGKGDTLNFAHFSEAANYQHFNDVLASVTQSIPRHSPFTYVNIESTANGISGKGEGYYKLWTKSVEEWDRFVSGKSDSFEGYRPIFVPWYDMGKYKLPLHNGKLIDIDLINFHSPETKKKHLDQEDWIINEVFSDETRGLEAVNWYRWCIKENCQYDILEAHRYYPTTPEQAFIASDNSFFDTNKLFTVKQNFVSNGEPEYELGLIDDDINFIPSPISDLKIWSHPTTEYWNRYCVSCDPSYGIEGGDYSCIMVYDRLEEEFVAKWYGNAKEDEVARILLNIAYYYNEALIIPEMNLRTITTLISPGGILEYTGPIYERYVKGRDSTDYGYNTLGSNKTQLLTNYASWLRNKYDELKDLDSIDEHINFIKKIGKGLPKLEAAEGKHDDIVIAHALCIEGANWWEDEIVELTSDKNDIKKIINKKPTYNIGFKASELGRKPSDLRGSQVKRQSLIGMK